MPSLPKPDRGPSILEDRPPNAQWGFIFSMLVHILSICTTMMLFVVYVKDLTWAPAPSAINMLLIAAKAHELLIVTSLSTILLHRVRVCLKGSQGIPLGFLACPFNLNASLYVFTSQFWKAATKSASNERGDVTTKVLILALMILSVASGPSASILVLPKLGWWAINPPDTPEVPSLTLIRSTRSGMDADNTYPRYLESGYFKGSCSSLMTSEPQPGPVEIPADPDSACPHTAAQQILNYIPRILGSNQQSGYISNYSVSGMYHGRDISVGWAEDTRLRSVIVYATSPMDIVSRELSLQGNGQWAKFHGASVKIALENERYSTLRNKPLPSGDGFVTTISTSRSRWRQPVLAIRCSPSSSNETHYLVDVPQRPFGAPESSEIPIVKSLGLPKSAFNVNSTPLGAFMDAQIGPSANLTTAFLWNTDKDADTLCLVTAKWADGDVWISKPNQRTAESSYSVDPSAATSAFADSADLITVTAEWASVLNAVISPQINPASNSTQKAIAVFERIRTACQKDIQCLSVTLSLYLTDALSRYMNSWTVYSCEGDPHRAPLESLKCMVMRGPEPNKSITEVRPAEDLNHYLGIATYYYGWRYAYRVSSGAGAESAAWVVLFLHATLVLIHFSEHYLRKKTYKEDGEGWSDVGELVALALTSEPPEDMRGDGLKGMGDTAEAWRLRIYSHKEGRQKSTLVARRGAWKNPEKRDV